MTRQTAAPLPSGTRIRTYGEQFPRAYREGTGAILRMLRAYQDGTYEYLVRRDDGTEVERNYVYAIEDQP